MVVLIASPIRASGRIRFDGLARLEQAIHRIAKFFHFMGFGDQFAHPDCLGLRAQFFDGSVDFNFGYDYGFSRTYSSYVRLVRAGQ